MSSFNPFIIFFLFSYQLKSNVVSLDSHIGQYAVICEKQRQEVPCNSQHYHAKPNSPENLIYNMYHIYVTSIWMFCYISKDSTAEAEIERVWGEERGAWGFF